MKSSVAYDLLAATSNKANGYRLRADEEKITSVTVEKDREIYEAE